MLLQAISTARQGVGSNPALQQTALGAMISAVPILSYAEFYSMQGTADVVPLNSTVAGGAGRTLNNDYTAVNTEVNTRTVTPRILGDLVKTDVQLERQFTGIEGIASERERQLISFSRGIGRYFTDQLFNGNNTAPQLNGIVAQVVAGQTLELGTADGDTVPVGNSDANVTKQETFLEKLYELINLVPDGAQVLVMSGKMIARLQAIGRSYVNITQVNDAFGVPQQFTSFNGVPIINAGFKKDNSTLVIGNAETVGESDDCTSIYAIRFGERENVTLATNIGLQVYDRGLVGVHYTTQVEMDVNVLVQNDKAVARLEGIRL